VRRRTIVIGLNGMNSTRREPQGRTIYFIKWFVGKSAGNNEPQKERRTQKMRLKTIIMTHPRDGLVPAVYFVLGL